MQLDFYAEHHQGDFIKMYIFQLHDKVILYRWSTDAFRPE